MDQDGKDAIDLLAAVAAIYRVIERPLDAHKLSPPQYVILHLARTYPDIKPTEIAALLMQQTHSVSGLLNRLEDRGLIERLRGRQDRRVVHVRLTPDGMALEVRARRDFEEAAGRLMDKTGDLVVNPRDLLDALVPLAGGAGMVGRRSAFFAEHQPAMAGST